MEERESIQGFRIRFESTECYPDKPSKTSYSFGQKKSIWYALKTEIIDRIDKKERKKTEFIVPPEAIESFLNQASSIKMPLLMNFYMGCDGGFTKFEYGGYGGGLKMRWWSAPSPVLEPFDEAISMLLDAIDPERF